MKRVVAVGFVRINGKARVGLQTTLHEHNSIRPEVTKRIIPLDR